MFALLLLVFRPARSVDQVHLMLTRRGLEGFSATGTIVVVAIVATGLINGWLLVGPAALRPALATLYGQLLLAGLVLVTDSGGVEDGDLVR